ncbi:hypothetical protein [Enterobacter soli]|uniref:hypothetical protein n=1 Tax=Enterobacter soli TaxID=885040 RepID=UPI002F413347
MSIASEVAYVCELLHKYDALPLECDGHSMVVSSLLDRFCIPHQRIVGEVTLAGSGQIIRPHLWIKYDEYIIDYRLRMWARQTADNVCLVPHGIFIEDKCHATYTVHSIARKTVIPDKVIDLMTDGIWSKILHDITHKN